MLNDLPLTMVKCLLLTVLIEGAAAMILGVRDKTDLLFTLLVNALTNPPLVVLTFFVGFYYGNTVRMPVEIAAEISAVLIEGFIYHKVLDYKKINHFLLSLILNGISYASGFVLEKFIF